MCQSWGVWGVSSQGECWLLEEGETSGSRWSLPTPLTGEVITPITQQMCSQPTKPYFLSAWPCSSISCIWCVVWAYYPITRCLPSRIYSFFGVAISQISGWGEMRRNRRGKYSPLTAFLSDPHSTSDWPSLPFGATLTPLQSDPYYILGRPLLHFGAALTTFWGGPYYILGRPLLYFIAALTKVSSTSPHPSMKGDSSTILFVWFVFVLKSDIVI